MFKEHYN